MSLDIHLSTDFKLGMLLDTTNLYSLSPFWITLIFTQVSGLQES